MGGRPLAQFRTAYDEGNDVPCCGVADSRFALRSAVWLQWNRRHQAVRPIQHRLSHPAELRSEMPVAPMAPDNQEIGRC